MNWVSLIYADFGALAAIEIFHAFRTREVALPFFGFRRKRASNPSLYWAMIGFWSLVFVASIYSLVRA